MRARARDPRVAGTARELGPLRTTPAPAVAELAALVIGNPPQHWRPVGGGQTHAEAWLIETEHGSRFLKAAVEDSALRALRAEIDIFRQVSGPFMPTFHGWAIENDVGVLVLEDLSDGRWPPPYPSDVTPLFDALAALARVEPPRAIARLGREGGRECWRRVGEDPTRLASVTGWTTEWISEVVPALSAAEERCVLDGRPAGPP